MKKTIPICVLAALLFGIANNSVAQIQVYTEFDDFNFGLWDGQSDETDPRTGCVAYLWFGFIPVASDYQMRVQMNSPAPGPGSPFRFYNDSNSAYFIPFAISVADLHAGGVPIFLSPNQYSNTLTYEPACGDDGPNAELSFSILASDMYRVPAGDYSVSTDVQVRRLNNGNPTNETDTQPNLRGTITIPPLVMISNMNDIDLGTYDGVSPTLFYNESYCIYANTSDYEITPYSTAGGTPGSFAVTDGSNNLEYTVRVSNTTDASGGTPLDNNETSPAMATNQSYPFSVNCNGGDNAAVYLEFDGASLQAAPPGDYSGTLNLMVAPI